MKILSVARKTLRELWREPMLLGLLFVFPIMVIWLYDVAYGQSEGGLARFLKIQILNQDGGDAALNRPLGDELTETIREMQYEGEAVFEVSMVSNQEEAEIALRERKVAMLLIIPPDFSHTLLEAGRGVIPNPPTTVRLVGDTTSDNFVFARSFLEGLVIDFARQATNQESAAALNYEFIPGTGTMSDFDFGVPGVIVFGIMLLTVITAMVMVRENVAGTLKRLQMTSLRARDLLLGVTLAQMVVALAMIPAILGAALAFGFKNNGSLWLATAIGLLTSLAAVGLGLMVACFARTDSEAANLGASVGVLMTLLSKAMYPVPDVPLFTIGGRTIQIFDLLPTNHAGEAMRRVMILGDGVRDIAFELTALVTISTLLFAVGIWMYQRLQLRKG